MKKINENKLAAEVCRAVKTNQGGDNKDISIAQVKAVVSRLRYELAVNYNPSEVLEWVERSYYEDPDVV